ncbi:MAG: hypothetical protein BGO55_01550 [Sphingobacteriales bacterium 50-39]|nr:amidotransferase [Sphingobacteriales bacterium]OJW53791.1 MAG: hypothetical protein BGO55_01550 [Sphingobacteriales bacterium 50-39]
MKIHVLQHVPFEGPGTITDWCRSHGHQMDTTPLYSPDHRLPSTDVVDMLIIMGGPMGVYDEETYPWLKTEKGFIHDFLQLDKPVLGICLGAQLLAVCNGAVVRPAPQKEIGWFPVKQTAAARNEPWFYSLFKNDPILFHWHGDRFEIPKGAVELAFTEANDNQAFLLNKKVLGLQFHAEVNEDGLRQMVQEGLHELQEGTYIQSAEILLASPSFNTAHPIMWAILDHLITFIPCH